MNTYQLSIKAHYHLGTLERILRVIRHRGGHIVTMNVNELAGQRVELSLTLSSSREKMNIVNQLTKLFDIISVE